MLNINLVLERVGLSPTERAVYISLLEGATAVKEIIKTTSEKRPTVYYVLNRLETLGLVSKTGKEYGNKFQVEPVEKIEAIVDQNIEKQKRLKRDVEDIIKTYSAVRPNNKTAVSYYDDQQAIKLAISYSLYGKNKIIRTIVPKNNLFDDLGTVFRNEYVEEKNKRGIATKAIWEEIPDLKVVNKYYGKNSEIKQMPTQMRNKFKTTVFIYDDKTLYISPLKDSYAVLIQSEEHTQFMNSIFDNTWASAKKLG